jgi:hypothetical protein
MSRPLHLRPITAPLGTPAEATMRQVLDKLVRDADAHRRCFRGRITIASCGVPDDDDDRPLPAPVIKRKIKRIHP